MSEKLLANIKNAIIKEMKSQGLSQAELLRCIDMNQSQFSKFINGNTSIKIDSLETIASGLGMKLSALLRKAENKE